MAKKMRKGEEVRMIATDIPVESARAFRAIAIQEERTVSQQLRIVVRDFLATRWPVEYPVDPATGIEY